MCHFEKERIEQRGERRGLETGTSERNQGAKTLTGQRWKLKGPKDIHSSSLTTPPNFCGKAIIMGTPHEPMGNGPTPTPSSSGYPLIILQVFFFFFLKRHWNRLSNVKYITTEDSTPRTCQSKPE